MVRIAAPAQPGRRTGNDSLPAVRGGVAVARPAWLLSLAGALITWLLVGPAAMAVEDIRPPFGLQWEESPDRLQAILDKAKATVVKKENVGDREAWTVQGIVHAGLRQTVFYFKDGGLVEVELQYHSDEWDARNYETFMADVRRKIEERFGQGQLLKRSKTTEGSVIQTMVAYKWNQNRTSIHLVYFAAEDANLIYPTISVHYKLQ